MATGFHEVQFPTDISYGSEGGPEFSTEVVELSGGNEVRNINWARPRERWNVAYGVKDEDDLAVLYEFFMARQGRAYGFRFKNHDDYSAVGETIGTGDDSETEFQLVKVYTSGGYSLSRKISKPVTGTVVVYDNGVEQESGWSVDTTTGIITFDSPPVDGHVITADFEFDVPVRFDTDYMPINISNYKARSASVPILEIKL